MNINVKRKEWQNNENKFKPFQLTVDVETLEDAVGLWHLFNIPNAVVRKDARDSKTDSCFWHTDLKFNTYNLWENIDTELLNQKFKKGVDLANLNSLCVNSLKYRLKKLVNGDIEVGCQTISKSDREKIAEFLKLEK